MTLTKYGQGEILPEPGDDREVAEDHWDPDEDYRALGRENTQADAER